MRPDIGTLRRRLAAVGGAERPCSAPPKSPNPLLWAYEVLHTCKKELGFPGELTIHWRDDFGPGDGEYDPRHPGRISIPRVLLDEPVNWAQLAYVIGHESLHASVHHGVFIAGTMPSGMALIDSEPLAINFGRRMAEHFGATSHDHR